MNSTSPVLPDPVARTNPPTPLLSVQTGTTSANAKPAASLAEVHAFLNAPVVVARNRNPASFFTLSTPAQQQAGGYATQVVASSPSTSLAPDGISPLGRAAFDGDLALVQVLLGARCNPNLMERGKAHGYTPMVAAAENGHVEVIEALLAAGADVNLKNNVGGRTALDTAARHGHLPVVVLLLRQPNIRLDEILQGRNTLLDSAALSGNAAVMEALMKVIKLPPDRVKEYMVSACRDGRLAIVDLLLRRGDMEADQAMSRGCLHTAAASGRENVVAYLLASGAAAGMSGGDAFQLLAGAACGKSIGVMDLLLATPDIHSSDVPLCFLAALAGHLPLLEHLIKKGVNPNMQNPVDGLNALMLAVTLDRMDMVELLLAQAHLQLDLASCAALTALEYAMSGDNRDAAMRLLKAGAKPRFNSEYESRTCLLRWAIDRRDGSLFKQVLQQCDMASPLGTRLCKSALAHAVQGRCVDIVESVLAVPHTTFDTLGLIGSIHRSSSNMSHAAAISQVLDAQLRLAEGMAAGEADAAGQRYLVDIDTLERYVEAIVIIDLQLACKPECGIWPLAAPSRPAPVQGTPLQAFQQLIAPLLSDRHSGADREKLLHHLHKQQLFMSVALPLSDCLGLSGQGYRLLATAGDVVTAQHRTIYYAAGLSGLDPLAQAATAGRLYASANISADGIARLSPAARLQFNALRALGDQASAALGEEMLEKLLPACLQRTDMHYQVDVAGLVTTLILAGLMPPLAQVVAQCWEDSVKALMVTPQPVPPGASFFDITQILQQALGRLGQTHFAARLQGALGQASLLAAFRQLTIKAETDTALPMLFQIQVDQLRQYIDQLQQG